MSEIGGSRPLIIAHRGSSSNAPENTFAAFKMAIVDGAEGIEFDVQLTRDNQAVVIHDPNLKRTGRRGGTVAEMTAEELGEVDVGSWFNLRFPAKANEGFAEERIATLAQTLELLRDFKGLIYIELKCDTIGIEGLCETVCREIKGSHLLPQIIVKSFELKVLPIVCRLCPEVQTAALFGANLMNAIRKETRIINAAKAFGAHQISVHYSLATRKLMEKAAAAGLPVTIWTADNTKWVARGGKLGLKAIITNDPARVLAVKYAS